MGEEVKIGDYDGGGVGDGDDDRVLEWEDGLPSAEDLAPLSQHLIPLELASAFRISQEPLRTMLDVNRAAQNTLSSLRGGHGHSQTLSSSNNFNFKPFNEERAREQLIMETDDTDLTREGSDSRKTRRTEANCAEEANSAMRSENCADDASAKTLKRPRLVWTPQLHKRFVDVVAHLGIKNAVPKTIMQLMNVEGLTRENVASHLQKYRLYLKRMQGLSTEGPSSSDHLFASTPVPQSLDESGGSGHGHGHNSNGNTAMPMPYAPQMMQMPMIGMAARGLVPSSGSQGGYHHQYNMMQQRDWSANKFGSVAAYHHTSGHDK